MLVAIYRLAIKIKYKRCCNFQGKIRWVYLVKR